jgi:hypothetical protein
MKNTDLKLNPYDRLQSILSEKNNGKLSIKAESKLDELLDIKKKDTIFSKFKNIFEKIDNFIFRKKIKRNNNIYYKRK